jgi:hypothetical protein
VWLDALTTNVDRTPRNPNLLLWHERMWLIDHGAALYLQHRGLDPAADAERPFASIAEHVLLPRAGSIMDADRRLRDRLAPDALRAAVALVPDDWLAGGDPSLYVDYLDARLGAERFAHEAEQARMELA